MIRNRIAVKLGLTIMCLFLIVLAPLGYVISSIFSNFYSDNLEKNMEHLSARYVDLMSRGGMMSTSMIGMMAEVNGVDVIVFDHTGKAIRETNMYDPPTIDSLVPEEIKQLSRNMFISKEEINEAGERYFFTVSVLNGESFNGALGVISSVEPAMEAVDQIQSLLILAGVGALFIAIGITLIITRRLSQPLLQMENAARRMAKGDLDVKVDVLSEDETGSLARTINELGDELKRYRDTRSELFANISHELRSPITYLEGYSQVLADGLIDSDEEKSKYLLIIHQEARRMKGLVEDLFELSKMEEGKISFNKEWMDLSEALQHVLNKVGPRVTEKGLILEQDIIKEIPYVLADGNRMEQIFFNLLDNAIRYTIKGFIRVNIYKDSSHVIIKIADTGLGIPKEELPYVFERFYRVEKSRSREFGGTGLGLAIVKKLVELQDGHIEIESKVNRGTTFIVKFPIFLEGVES